MERRGNSELVIESVGCGRFQVIHGAIVGIVSYFAMVFSNHFMSFGNYNPGWRCIDVYNETVFVDNLTRQLGNVKDDKTGLKMVDYSMDADGEPFSIKNNVTSEEYTHGDCSVFKSCKNVQFNPETSTIVTEWGLVCGDAWIPSFIITLQMIGLGIGSSLAGVASDAFGRKWVINIALMFILILNIISIFSTSWQMFAVLRLLLGISTSFQIVLYYIYLSEFVTKKWRAIVMGMPGYPFGVVLFSLTCFLFKDWRHVHITTCVIGAIGLIPAFWLPESLRWLEVKNKTTEFHKTAELIAKCNGKALPTLENLNGELKSETKNPNVKLWRDILKLFGKRYRKYTIIVTLPWISVSLLYYAIAFGVKALSGNFYLNLILFYAIEVVLDFILMFAPNVFGRKKTGVAFCGFSGICLLVAACFQELVSGNAKMFGVTAPVMFARISISSFWVVLQLFIVEIYPTVVRGAANSWGQVLARVGGIIAPVLIPTEAGTVYICYAVMGTLGVICAILVMLLPETRGKTLQQTFEEDFRTVNDDDDDEPVL